MGIYDLVGLSGVAVWFATMIVTWFVWARLKKRVVSRGTINRSDYGWFFARIALLGICLAIGCALIVVGLMGSPPNTPTTVANGGFYIAFCSGSAFLAWLLLFLALITIVRLALWNQKVNSSSRKQ